MQVREGQRVLRENYGLFIFAWEAALILGCRVARFADVMLRSGKCMTPLHTFRRFRETAIHVTKWAGGKANARNPPKVARSRRPSRMEGA